MSQVPNLLTEEEAAGLLRISQRHLKRLRASGAAPPHVDLGGRRIAYARADLNTWIKARTQRATPKKDPT